MMITGGFLILLYLSRKEDTDEDTPFWMGPFYKVVLYLYKKNCSRLSGLFAAPQVEQDLRQLCPGERGECLKTRYYVKKGAVSMAILLAGTLFAAAVKYSTQKSRILGENGAIERGGYQNGARDVHIQADYGEKQYDFQISVEPVMLSGEEREALFEEFAGQLTEYILGGNESLQNITSDLDLKEYYRDFPIRVEWESSRPDLLGDTGYVSEVEEQEKVTLLAHLIYGIYGRTEEIEVTLAPSELTEEEKLIIEMQEMLMQSQDESAEQQEWILPQSWRGESIAWKQVVEDNSMLLWAAAAAASIMAYLLSDRDLHRQLERRKRAIHREYPEIVHKLLLFTGAGMTVRGAFQKIAGDYELKRKNGSRESPAYEEMLYTCRELRSGVSEGAAYENFGKRTGLQEYIRLSALLMQNLKRGNSALLERLREEAAKAAQEQLQQGKKQGEAAGTKLLAPMVLMLMVIMIVIMIPAFSGM